MSDAASAARFCVTRSKAVIVRAIDREAEVFWQSCGFTPSSSDPSILFRSIRDIAAWLIVAAEEERQLPIE
jgi:hypothetical protein